MPGRVVSLLRSGCLRDLPPGAASSAMELLVNVVFHGAASHVSVDMLVPIAHLKQIWPR